MEIKNKIDNFETKAKTWDNNQSQINLTSNFVSKFLDGIMLYKKDKLVEVGCGTGLVGLKLAKYVNEINLIDNSPAMLKVLREKIQEQGIDNTKVFEGELENINISAINGIITFMALHHIENIERFFDIAFEKLSENGFIAIGDLIREDGSFHTNTDVPHNGFEINILSNLLRRKGFIILRKQIYDYREKNNKKYPIFIIIAQK